MDCVPFYFKVRALKTANYGRAKCDNLETQKHEVLKSSWSTANQLIIKKRGKKNLTIVEHSNSIYLFINFSTKESSTQQMHNIR